MKKLVDGVLVDLTKEEEQEYQKALQELSNMPPNKKTDTERISELENANTKLQEELNAFKILMGQEV